ncbi:MAG: zinc ribbon domain-containing protein [Candidatus Coatesbacteria bacterium]|nr:MAG: zinc ribbon domain-containing protein [Candidatus Coatesbacteria bacterium]
MRQFKCAECGQEFEVAQTTVDADLSMNCPSCGGAAHRLDAGGPPADRGASQRSADQHGASQRSADQHGASQRGAGQHGASQRGGARRGASQRRGGQRAGKDPDND